VAELVDELIELVREDAAELGCLAEVERAREIVANGTSADRQLAIYRDALREGASPEEALRLVVDWLMRETLAGLPG
jgi:carboxylate-amine ligase